MMLPLEEVPVMSRFSFPLSSRVLTFVLCVAICGISTWSAERVVDLTAGDGMKLKATYFAAAKPGPGVLLLHQCNRQRKIWDVLAQQLAAAGINVLTLDYRGYGESGGDRFDKLPPQEAAQVQTEKWPGDIDTAFQYLASQPGVMRGMIGVGGASCGVNNSIQTARRHPEVKSLALLSGSTDLKGRQFLRESTKLPVFFAVADDDEFPLSIVAIEWLYSLAADPDKKFVHVATGGHGADMFKVHPDMPGEIVNWYVTTLIKTPGRAPGSKEMPTVSEEVHLLDELDQPGGVTKVAKKLEEARQRDPNAKLFREDFVNVMGYEHLQASDNKGAIEILRLNVQAYPNSPNVYDSLSDAYFAEGQRDLARDNAKKALQLLASDTTDPEDRRNAIKASAEQKLKQLGEAP
jgi:dienelactone hydrolase